MGIDKMIDGWRRDPKEPAVDPQGIDRSFLLSCCNRQEPNIHKLAQRYYLYSEHDHFHYYLRFTASRMKERQEVVREEKHECCMSWPL